MYVSILAFKFENAVPCCWRAAARGSIMPKHTNKMSVSSKLQIMDILSLALHISRDSPLPDLKLHLPSPETPGLSTVNRFWKNALSSLPDHQDHSETASPVPGNTRTIHGESVQKFALSPLPTSPCSPRTSVGKIWISYQRAAWSRGRPRILVAFPLAFMDKARENFPLTFVHV